MPFRVMELLDRRFVFFSRPFGLAMLLLLSAVLTGIGVGQVASRKDEVASAAPQTRTVVLQESSDWLSESYWRRHRRTKNRRGRLRQTSNQSFLGLRQRSGARRSQQGGRAGNYRTVCVRLCDGYYFPVSFSTTRDRFAKDERACRSRCSSDARLFYYRNSDGSPETMKDRRGRSYAKLKTAFLYRTTYKKTCACRSDPWSDESEQRHATYRKKGWKKRARRLAKLEARRARIAARKARNRPQVVVLQPPPSEAELASRLAVDAVGRPNATVVIADQSRYIRRVGKRRQYSSNRMSLGRRGRVVNRSRPRTRRRRNKNWQKRAFSTDN